jgi:hypothetical protein
VLIAAAISSLIALHPVAAACDAGTGAGPVARALAPFALPADSALVALYESGQAFDAFLAVADARKAMWEKNWNEGVVSDELLAQARAIPGRWRLLIVAVDGCSDSVNTVPYLARLVALVPSIELRIVQPGAGKAVQEAHRTPDGRAATPTLVVIDEAGNDVGCWVERPKELQGAAIKARAEDRVEEWARGKQAWYDADAGASTLREVVAVIAAAAAGTPICGEPMVAPPALAP